MALNEELAFIKSLKWDGGLMPVKSSQRPRELAESNGFNFLTSSWVGGSSPFQLGRTIRDFTSSPQNLFTPGRDNPRLPLSTDLMHERLIHTMLLRLEWACREYGQGLVTAGYSMTAVGTPTAARLYIRKGTSVGSIFYQHRAGQSEITLITEGMSGISNAVAPAMRDLMQRVEIMDCGSRNCNECALMLIVSLAMVSTMNRYIRAFEMPTSISTPVVIVGP